MPALTPQDANLDRFLELFNQKVDCWGRSPITTQMMLTDFSQQFGQDFQTLEELSEFYRAFLYELQALADVTITDEDVADMQESVEIDCGLAADGPPVIGTPESVAELRALHNEVADCLADAPPDFTRQILDGLGAAAEVYLATPDDYRSLMTGIILGNGGIENWTPAELSSAVQLHSWVCGSVQ